MSDKVMRVKCYTCKVSKSATREDLEEEGWYLAEGVYWCPYCRIPDSDQPQDTLKEPAETGTPQPIKVKPLSSRHVAAILMGVRMDFGYEVRTAPLADGHLRVHMRDSKRDRVYRGYFLPEKWLQLCREVMGGIVLEG